MNYPPGITDKDFNDDWERALEEAADQLNIKFRLVAETEDGEVLYDESFFSTNSLEESGLRKADSAADQAIKERAELNEYIATHD